MHGKIILKYYDNKHYHDFSKKLEESFKSSLEQELKLRIINTEFERDIEDEYVSFEFIVNDISFFEKNKQ